MKKVFFLLLAFCFTALCPAQTVSSEIIKNDDGTKTRRTTTVTEAVVTAEQIASEITSLQFQIKALEELIARAKENIERLEKELGDAQSNKRGVAAPPTATKAKKSKN